MPRPAPGPASVAADLDRHAAGERPEWVTPTTWRRLRGAVEALRADGAALVAREGPTAAAETLGVARSTLDRWRAPGGWLHEVQPPAQGDP